MVKRILKQRSARYGNFETESEISEALKAILRLYYTKKHKAYMRSALEFNCHKMARILNGDPTYADNWVDISGYATIVSEKLKRRK